VSHTRTVPSKLPQEDGLVAAGRDEAVVISVDVNGEDFVAVSRVLVDETGRRCACNRRDGGDGRLVRVVKADCAVRGAGQDIRLGARRVGDSVDYAIVTAKPGNGRRGERGHGERSRGGEGSEGRELGWNAPACLRRGQLSASLAPPQAEAIHVKLQYALHN
jgi:hypothetical protein